MVWDPLLKAAPEGPTLIFRAACTWSPPGPAASGWCSVSRHAPPSPTRSPPSRYCSFIERVFADSGYAGERVAEATRIAVAIIRAQPGQVGFAVQPRRWVVERFFAWINRNRRLAKDFEATIASATAFVYAASAMLLTRRLGRCA